MTIEEIIDRYNIQIDVDYVDGEIIKTGRICVMDVQLMKKENAKDLIHTHRDEIFQFLSKQFDTEQKIKAERRKKIDGIEGLKILKDAIRDIENWHYEFEKSFDDVGGLGVRPYPEHDITALKEKYPRAAAFLLAESWEYMPHYMRSTAGIKAKERIINGEDYNEVIKDMKAEWDEYIKDHRWD